MNNQMGFITLKDTLMQSEFARVQYENVFSSVNMSFKNLLFDDIEELYNQIVAKYHLTEFQLLVLNPIINQLNLVRENIDPNRL
jgi:hypothetical protein